MTRTSEDGANVHGRLPTDQFAAVFEKTPGLHLVLDPSFTIVAATDAYCAATMTDRDKIVGHHLFEVFPDDPDDYAADGVKNLRASLLQVLKSRTPDRMTIQKYGIRQRGSDVFETRYWSPFNVPVLGADGYVQWIIHCVEDLTELVGLRAEFAARRDGAAAQRILVRLRDAERELEAERDENAELRETIRKQAKT
ncbi:MAG: PAS domain-containing protein [Rhizomicrobium sp.]